MDKSPFEVPKYGLGFRTAAHLGIDNIGMGRFDKSRMAYSRGEPYPQEVGMDFPEEQIICCAGTHYFIYPPKDRWPMNQWFVEGYHKMFGKYPTYPCYHAAQAIFTYKAAVEKAASLVGGLPSMEEIGKAAGGISLETPSGILTIMPPAPLP